MMHRRSPWPAARVGEAPTARAPASPTRACRAWGRVIRRSGSGSRLAKGDPKLRTVTVELPAGLSFASHGIGQPSVVLTGASIKAIGLSHGHLVITLRKPASSVVVKINAGALRERPSLERLVKHRNRHSLPLTVITENTKGRRATIHAQIRIPGS